MTAGAVTLAIVFRCRKQTLVPFNGQESHGDGPLLKTSSHILGLQALARSLGLIQSKACVTLKWSWWSSLPETDLEWGLPREELNSRAACLSSKATQWLLLFHLTPPTSLLPIGIRWCIPSCALTSAAISPTLTVFIIWRLIWSCRHHTDSC